MSKQFEKLSSLLKELFQTDQADLDFGIYRVINQRRDEINRFLDEELLPQVEAAFSVYKDQDKQKLEADLVTAIEEAQKLEVDPETSGRVKRIREQIATYSVDVSDLENQVYADLYNFFRRYYDEGDFISQRRYKEGVYAIPYEGEEVKLHWANHDQYYIKTSEYFRDYSFKLPSGKQSHFRLVEADTEKDNRKEIDDKKRRFVLSEEPLGWENGEIIIRFEFRPDDTNRSQAKCNEATLETIWELREGLAEQTQKDILAELAVPSETNKARTILEKHLEDYTRRNTQDYFIHKDLGKFLRRELDFFIKNEIMHLDNIEHEIAPRVEQYLSKIKVVRQIAHKIIDFLAQIEDFQKKLWLKKKFVIETNYCITLDRIPEELYPEIAANEAQREEWVRLFAIDEIQANGDMFKVSYCEPLSVEFLDSNKYLVLDTKFFSQEFKYRLLSNIVDIDRDLDGLIIHSENFQAINLLSACYSEKIKGIYIDPPYNTSASEIIYKNNYKHSSWLSFLENRLSASLNLIGDKSITCIAIDDSEFHRLYSLLISVFGEEDRILGAVSIRVNPAGRATQSGFSIAHDYAVFIGKTDKAEVGHLPKSEKQIARYAEIDDKGRYEWVNFRKHGGANANRIARPKLFYPIFITDSGSIRIPNMRWDDNKGEYIVLEQHGKHHEKTILPINTKGEEKTWKWGHETVIENIGELTIRPDQTGNSGVYMKSRMQEGTLPRTLWIDKKYSGTDYGTNLLTDVLGESNQFSFPKSVYTVEDSLRVLNLESEDICLDFFAGSGTTAHALINLNRFDAKKRKFILVEMGEYFEKVLIPRVKKIIYSDKWKNGKPVTRKGISQAFKYLRVESYEDTLNNLKLTNTEGQQSAFVENPDFHEDYMLHYKLEIESKGSLLDLEVFEAPFDYRLEIATSTVGETAPTKIDLVETFDYLLGLQVKTIHKIDGVVVVRGTTQNERNIVILWRTVAELDADQLDDFFRQHLASDLDSVTDIYVNGDNNLANLRPKKQHWNVHLIEESFHQLMFEDSGV